MFGFVLFFFRCSIHLFFFSLHICIPVIFLYTFFFLFLLSVHFNLMYFSSIINEKVLYLQKVSLGLQHICTFAMGNINWFDFTWYHSFDGKCCVDRYSQKNTFLFASEWFRIPPPKSCFDLIFPLSPPRYQYLFILCFGQKLECQLILLAMLDQFNWINGQSQVQSE